MSFQFPDVLFGISEAQDGQMKFNGDSSNEEVWERRKAFFAPQGIDVQDTIGAMLVHEDHIEEVHAKDKGTIFRDTDGFVTNEKNLFLTITVADCVPMYFYDPENKAVGIIHAGWRGTVKNIAGAAVAKLYKLYGSKPEDIFVYLGPHIQQDHFEIKDDILHFFDSYPEYIIREQGKIFVSLAGILKKQLLDAGIKEEYITVSGACTACEQKYFSYRRDKPKALQAMVAYIGLKPELS